ncbi:related to O-methyltransferase B [Cephalotrichum gorgonifer]|uniref:Related to O-methyltransferase B n=1 Tax=Cephalotrichum gorgonifer TaxID=2041049 RepID=A0AAE8N845_9PEZI|nr:related to O-methyltransferase B [Cephalotrichum gorgonifer]
MAEVNENQTNGSAANGSLKKPVVDMSVALTANNLAAVPDLAKGISSLSAAAADGDEQARLDLVEKARQLVRSLETPRETMIKHCWAQPSVFTALTVGIDTGLFAALAEDGGSPKTAQDLAKKLHIDPPLLCRLMRHIASMGYIDEVGADTYKPTNFSSSLTIPEIGGGYPCIAGGLAASLYKFPEYAIKTDYKTPNSISNGSLQYAYNTEHNMFEHLHANPPYGQQFNNHMGGYRQGRPSWMDDGFYPVQQRLLDGFEDAPDAALLVDVGGGLGHDLDEFRRKTPGAPGRLVLQDLGNVLGEIVELDSRIERMTYDFHTEQPVKGARAYYMHSVLHDWPDEVAAQIIARIKEAMKPGYSRLLINENVVPPEKAQWEATALDIMMLTLLSSRERTQGDWEHLVQELGGLRITKIYTAANGVESIIECELVE